MSRSDRERLLDIQAACDAITSYDNRDGIDEDIFFDAIRVRLIEIGEAVKDIDAQMLATEPAIRWTDIARMRDQLAHRYFDTTHAVVCATASNDIPILAAAMHRLLSVRQSSGKA